MLNAKIYVFALRSTYWPTLKCVAYKGVPTFSRIKKVVLTFMRQWYITQDCSVDNLAEWQLRAKASCAKVVVLEAHPPLRRIYCTLSCTKLQKIQTRLSNIKQYFHAIITVFNLERIAAESSDYAGTVLVPSFLDMHRFGKLFRW